MKKAIFAGTFDPITVGHESVIEKAYKMFDELTVAICINPEKTTLFSVEKRLEMINAVCKKYKSVKVVYHKGLLTELMKQTGILYNVRGVRNNTDYNYENSMHYINKSLYPEMVTIYIPCEKEFLHVSSTAVREALRTGKDLHKYLSAEVIEIINKDLKQ